MTDSVEVRPRYKEPDAPLADTDILPQQVSPAVNTPAAVTSVPTRGLFTSMYENKIIVLIIVIVIIIIGIIAYVIYRKPEDESDKVKPATDKTGGVQNQQPPAAAQKHEAAPEQSRAGVKMNKNNLVNLLARSKNSPAQPPQEVSEDEEPVMSKTDEEIMQLMEDQESDDEDDQNVAGADTDVESAPVEAQQSPPNEQTILATEGQVGLCTAVVPPGRNCRNRARNNGKCPRHGG